MVREVYSEIETLTKRQKGLRLISCECVCVFVCVRGDRCASFANPATYSSVKDGTVTERAAFA